MVHETKFLGSFEKTEQCPASECKEFAFIGRSNVGKSTLINYITNKKDLAKVSQTPGKTQLLNFFLINKNWNLVDLPGYGYAKVSKDKRAGFDKMIRFYLKNREQLTCVFSLIDASIPPQKLDIEFINWLGENHIPFVIIFTKTDKEKQNAVHKNITDFKAKLSENWETLPTIFTTSSEKKIGAKTILEFIENCCE